MCKTFSNDNIASCGCKKLKDSDFCVDHTCHICMKYNDRFHSRDTSMGDSLDVCSNCLFIYFDCRYPGCTRVKDNFPVIEKKYPGNPEFIDSSIDLWELTDNDADRICRFWDRCQTKNLLLPGSFMQKMFWSERKRKIVLMSASGIYFWKDIPKKRNPMKMGIQKNIFVPSVTKIESASFMSLVDTLLVANPVRNL